MDSTLKQRLIGAAVLAALAVIFLPMLLKGPDVKEPDAAEVPLTMPATPGQEFETRELPLTAPDTATPPGGVLGMTETPPAAAEAAGAGMPVPDENALPADPVASPAPTAPAVAGVKPGATESTAAALPPAAVGAGNYAVNVGSFSNPETAGALATKLRAAKLPVTTEQVALAGGNATRIRVGPYVDRASAEAARLRAEAVTGGTANVIVLDAKPTVPASTAAKPAVAIATGFAVQLSAPSVEADALALRDRARAAGFNSFVQRIETDGGVRFRVRVGPVADRPAAETLRDAVNAKLGSKSIIVSNP